MVIGLVWNFGEYWAGPPIFTILNPKMLLYKLDTLNLFTFACVAVLGSRFFIRLLNRACGSRCIARCNVIVDFLIFKKYVVQCLDGIVVPCLEVWLKCQIAIKFVIIIQPTIRLFFWSCSMRIFLYSSALISFWHSCGSSKDVSIKYGIVNSWCQNSKWSHF